MAKKKKQKKPNIPVQTIARSRLDKILVEYYNGELNEDECVASIRALMEEVGNEPVLNSLIGMLDNASAEQTDALMVALSRLGNEQTIQHLWQLVRRSKLSVGGKMTALVILKQMGEDVDLDNPGEYFSWRDIKKADVGEIAHMGRVGLQGIIKELQKIRNVDDAEAMMMQFDAITDMTGGAEMTHAIIDDLVAMGDSGAADLLAAISATTHDPEKRKAARTGLLKLSGQKIFPQSEIGKSMLDERFYGAYCTDPAHPWQQQVILAFERGKNQVQALVFLLDFGHPWNGAIKDFWPSRSVPPQQFHREFLDRAGVHDIEQRQVSYTRARKFILDAVEANRKNKIKLPEDYVKYRYLVERRIIDPSPGTLAYAQQVDARTEDEWGELDGEPIRGMQVITGPDGKDIVLLDDFLGEDMEEPSFEAVLFEVEGYYSSETDDDKEPIPHNWVTHYLTTQHNKGFDPDELYDRWDNIGDFMFFLNQADDAPKSLEDIQGYHLSEFITEFWDKELTYTGPVQTTTEAKRNVIKTVQDLYLFLAQQKYISDTAAKQVSKAAATILQKEGQLTPIPK